MDGSLIWRTSIRRGLNGRVVRGPGIRRDVRGVRIGRRTWTPMRRTIKMFPAIRTWKIVKTATTRTMMASNDELGRVPGGYFSSASPSAAQHIPSTRFRWLDKSHILVLERGGHLGKMRSIFCDKPHPRPRGVACCPISMFFFRSYPTSSRLCLSLNGIPITRLPTTSTIFVGS